MEDDPAWLDAMGKRKCTKCGNVKIHSHMKKDKRRPFGIQKICKDCDNMVWPKHLKYRQARIAKRNAKALRANALVFDIRPQTHTINSQIIQKTGKSTVPAGLTPHPQELVEKYIPSALPPASPVKSLAVNTPDPAALQVAKPSHTTTPEDKFISALSKVGPVVEGNKNPCVEIKIAPVKKEKESPSQEALRSKMERDGFDKGMIEGAVRMLPRILKDLKELRDEGVI